MQTRGCMLSASHLDPSHHSLPLSLPTSSLLDSFVDQLVMPASCKVAPVTSRDIGPMGYRRNNLTQYLSRVYTRHITWRMISVAALLVNVCSAAFMAVAYIRGRWEVGSLCGLLKLTIALSVVTCIK